MDKIIKGKRGWGRESLDSLTAVRYCAGHSKYNPIERVWAVFTLALAGGLIPFTAPGESLTPFQQKLSNDEKEAKIKLALDKAVNILCEYYQPVTYDGWKAKPNPTYADTADIYSDAAHETSKNCLNNSSKADVEADSGGLFAEMQFLLKHCIRTTYMTQFLRCDSGDCSCNVGHRPQSEALKCMKSFRPGHIPTPIPKDVDKGHFFNLIEMLERRELTDVVADEHLPSGNVKRCEKGCRGFVFIGSADQKRHDLIMHSS